MKKMILCLKCAESWKNTAKQTGEPHKCVEGTAIDNFRCDSCNEQIASGAKCAAFTVVPKGKSIYGQNWEADYIIMERKHKKMNFHPFEITSLTNGIKQY